MGEKSGGLTNMIIVLVALVVVVAFVRLMFPEVTGTITDEMKSIITNPTAGFIGSFKLW